MDTNIGSVVAFRKPGSEQRRRVAAGLVAAAVVALTVVVAWEAFRVPTTVITPPQAGLPAGWVRCTNGALGYSIGYPGDWFTTDVFDGVADPANACRWFSPDPFGSDGNVVAEGWGYPLEIGIGGSFEEERLELRAADVGDVLEEEPVMVGGHRAIRTEYVSRLGVVADAGRHYQYLIELDDDTSLIVHTTETRGIAGDYRENKTVVDQAVDTLRFAETTTGS